MYRRLALLPGLALVVALVGVLPGCGRPTPRPVSLYRVDPAVPTLPAGDPAPEPLWVGAAPVVSPQETLRSYGSLFAYLGRKLGRPVEMVQRRTYQETYDLLRFGSVDLGLVCTYVYIKGQKEFGLELLAAPVVNGRAQYFSLIITQADGGSARFDDLAGKRFVFTDPLSTSGYMYPLALLRQAGKEPGTFFASTAFTYSHDNSIRAVLQRLADGAAVDSLVYDQWVLHNPGLADQLKVVGRSPAFASPPFVAGPGVNPEVKEQVRQLLLTMHQDPEGRSLLAALGIDRFAAVSDGDYASVRENAARAGAAP